MPVTWKGALPPDDPIFTGGVHFVFFSQPSDPESHEKVADDAAVAHGPRTSTAGNSTCVTERKLVGHLRLDSAQVLILDPVGLQGERAYQAVVEVALAHGAGEVGDGVVVATGTSGSSG
jgi:hypothetical protein